MDETAACGECKRFTPLIYDSSRGDVICGDCGLVLEARTIDEGQEWRNFSDSGATQGGARAEKASPFDELETLIARTVSSSASDKQKRLFPRDHEDCVSRNKREAFAAIDRVADIMRINESVILEAKIMCADTHQSLTRRKFDKAEIAAACLYHCSKVQGIPVTPKMFASAIDAATADSGKRTSSSPRKSAESRFSACYKLATSTAKSKTVFVKGENYINMYGSSLGLERRQTARVKILYGKIKDANLGGSVLNGVAACLLHVATTVSSSSESDKSSLLARVSEIVGIGKPTIAKTLDTLTKKGLLPAV